MHNPAMNDQPNPAAPESPQLAIEREAWQGRAAAAKARVLARWPDAILTAQAFEGWCIYVGECRKSGYFDEEEDAWINADSRLAAIPVPPPATMDDGTPLDATSKRCIAEKDTWRGPLETLEDYATRLRKMLVAERIAASRLRRRADHPRTAAEGKRTGTFEEWWATQEDEYPDYVGARTAIAKNAWNAARETKEDEG